MDSYAGQEFSRIIACVYATNTIDSPAWKQLPKGASYDSFTGLARKDRARAKIFEMRLEEIAAGIEDLIYRYEIHNEHKDDVISAIVENWRNGIGWMSLALENVSRRLEIEELRRPRTKE
jgi:hypothetical protein